MIVDNFLFKLIRRRICKGLRRWWDDLVKIPSVVPDHPIRVASGKTHSRNSSRRSERSKR